MLSLKNGGSYSASSASRGLTSFSRGTGASGAGFVGFSKFSGGSCRNGSGARRHGGSEVSVCECAGADQAQISTASPTATRAPKTTRRHRIPAGFITRPDGSERPVRGREAEKVSELDVVAIAGAVPAQSLPTPANPDTTLRLAGSPAVGANPQPGQRVDACTLLSFRTTVD